MVEDIFNYIHSDSTQVLWEKHASVRAKPRRLLPPEEPAEFYFPATRQPLCIHPDVIALGGNRIHFILIQSLYKYMNDIANIETDIINKVAYNITKNAYKVKFSPEMRHDALSIIIDESYHAYVALDFMNQVRLKTRVEPLLLPTETELSKAIKDIKSCLTEENSDNFELIAICIAEHALTNDLIDIAKADNVCKTFYQVMQDHAQDEGRHAKYFATVLEKVWSTLTENQKQAIGYYLPELIKRYLQSSLQSEFDKQILVGLSLPSNKIDNILQETHMPVILNEIKNSNIVVKQVMKLLHRTKVLNHAPTASKFSEYGLI